MKAIFLSWLGFCEIACVMSAAAPASIAKIEAGTAEKTYSLFMGTDISVEFGNAFRRVRDVSRSSWVITVDGQPEFIPTERRALNLRVERSLKLTQKDASIANLRAERAYTVSNDPRQQAMRTQVQMSALAMERSTAADAEYRQALEARSATANSIRPPGPEATQAMQDAETRVGEAMMGLQSSADFATSSITGSSLHEQLAAEQEKRENFDALAAEFDLSSDRPLQNPYMVVVAQFREKSAPPNVVRNWIHAQSLEPIDREPQKIRLLRGGFPLGYVLDKVDVHIYSEGAEVATNLSAKHVPLTRQEAFQYLVIEHIGGNKGKTVPAVPVMAELAPEVKTRLAAGEGQQVYYVVVSAEGLVTQAYEDSDHIVAVRDPFFAAAVKSVWFKPALEKGKPVVSKATVNISRLPSSL
jgi:hypothetical protein